VSERTHVEVVCPNNHNQTIKYSEPEFEGILTSGTLIFHCNTCDTDWSPSGNEIAMIRKQFKKKPDQ
jgi:hypothetical protein